MADVRVRLSAEGTAEVVAALRKVQEESASAMRRGAAGATLFNNALRGVQATLGRLGIVLSIAAAVDQMRRLATGGIEAADSLQRFQSRTAASSANLTALKLAANDAEVSLEDVVKQLGRSQKVIGQAARNPGGDAAAPLRAIGLTQEAIAGLKGKDAVEQLDVIARAFAKLPPSVDRSAAAIAIFGRQGSELVPLLDTLGRQGLPGLIARAAELGIILDEEVIEAAAAMDKSFDDLGTQSEALGTQFVSGLSGPVRSALSAMSKQVAGSGKTWQEFGRIVGEALRFLIATLATATRVVLFNFKFIADAIGTAVRVGKRLLKGDFDGAEQAADDFINEMRSRTKNFSVEMKQLWKDAFSPPPPPDDAPKAVADSNNTLEELYRERLEIQRAALDAELRMAKASAKLREEAEDVEFDRRLKSIEEHYAKRRELAIRAINEEIAILQKKLLVETQAPSGPRRNQATLDLENQIALLAQQRAIEIEKLNAREQADLRRNTEERLRALAKLRGSDEDEHERRMREIREQADALRELNRLKGLPTDEIDREQQKQERKELARKAASDTLASGSLVLDGLAREREKIEARVNAGLQSEVSAQQEILEKERARLETLRLIGAAIQAAARESKDPEQIARAQEFMDSVAAVALSVEATENIMARLGATAVDVTQQSLASFLSLEQGIGSAVRNIISSLQRLIAELLATQIVTSLLRSFGGGSLSIDQQFSFDTVIANRAKGGIVGYARGGRLRGRGTGTSDSNLGISFPSRQLIAFSDGEGIVRSEAMRKAKVRELVDLINWNKDVPSFAPSYGDPATFVTKFAEGGQVGAINEISGAALAAGERGAQLGGHLDVSLDSELLAAKLEAFLVSPKGERAQLRTLAKYRRSATRALGGS